MMIANKKWLIVSAILAIVLCSAGAGIYVFKKKKSAAPAGTAIAPAASAPLDIAIKDYKSFGSAIKEKDVKYCQEISLGPDECLIQLAGSIARETGEVSLCDRLADKTKIEQCRTYALYQAAVGKKDAAACLGLAAANDKDLCLKELLGGLEDLKECGRYTGEVKELCLNLVYPKIAYRENRSGLCDKITDQQLKAGCLDLMKKKDADSDNDGLSDSYEVQILTDPQKADTDGDGIKDGEELRRGLNPLVKGAKLNK